ncbi:ATP-binding cassette domain-containing protein [Paenibacillus caui]|uniref:ATP-binding cassette domain-containing protein n=1 Tax=Paenibacillus caui TaxID=2873927 RepID=UPI001CA7EBAD|nr:ATP-binding cassette domain-containing protein [Paenibacillus caui]
MSIIQLINVSKNIGKSVVLNHINLELDEGRVYAFYGSNGSGKSMLFRAISGLIKPSTGEIIVQGKTLHKDCSFPESIGVIIESPGFWDSYTGFDNLKMLASIKNKITAEDICKAINRVGLNPNDPRKFKKYSLGMKQRLAIAQAVMEKPDILILDEPTNALDEDGIDLVRQIIREEKARGGTVLIASHNKEDVELLADHKFRMKNGQLLNESEDAK